MTDVSHLEEQDSETLVRKYLDSLNYTLLGDYDLSQPVRKEACVQWFMKHLTGMGLVQP